MSIEKNIDNVWKKLSDGAMRSKSPFHIIYLAYQSEMVESCSIVLQALEHGAIHFHTHAGAPKVAAIKQTPGVSLLGYDSQGKLQLRMKGIVTINHQNAVSEKVWQSMRDSSKLCYQLDAPSSKVKRVASSQDERLLKLRQDPMTGYENFVVCHVELIQIDCLELHYEGHIRSLFKRVGDKWECEEIQA